MNDLEKDQRQSPERVLGQEGRGRKERVYFGSQVEEASFSN
jgi:hypothetical protein